MRRGAVGAGESGFCQKIKLKSYPLVERGGVLWAYMGPPEQQPPLPEWEFATVPAEQQLHLQAPAGDATGCRRWKAASIRATSRSCIAASSTRDPLFKGAKGNQYNLGDAKPVFEVVESPGGLFIGARRNAEDGNYYWRITQWVMPSFTMIPPRGDHPVHGHFWVPIDDENCWAWSFDYHADPRRSRDTELQAMRDGKGIHVTYEPGTFRPLANKDNDYLIDRAAQKAGRTYSGVDGIAMQDASLQESMGPIVDRTKENLVSTDNGIIMARHRLLRAPKAMEKGVTPPGVEPEHQRVRSAAVVLPPDQPVQGRGEGSAEGAARPRARVGVTCSQRKRPHVDCRGGALPHRRAELASRAPSRSSRSTSRASAWSRSSRRRTGTTRPSSPPRLSPHAACSERFAGWLSDLAGRTKDLIDEVNSADLVVMVAAAGENAQAASLIGEACSLRG